MARDGLCEELARLDRLVRDQARDDAVCRRLMTVPGVGAVVALGYVAAIDDPARCARSKAVGPALGVTPSRYQSGEADRRGAITKAGDARARVALFEAAHVMITRVARWFPLDPQTRGEMAAFLADYMPMKFGSCLTSKLNKKDAQGRHYWERENSHGKPFVLAVADFHKEATENGLGPMTYTQSALWPYLYGHRVEWEMVDGALLVKAVPNPCHTFASKAVPSGFFDLPGAENVSAVLFFNAGTISKFDRMGVVAGFVPANHTYLRVGGFRYNPERTLFSPDRSVKMWVRRRTPSSGQTSYRYFITQMHRSRFHRIGYPA